MGQEDPANVATAFANAANADWDGVAFPKTPVSEDLDELDNSADGEDYGIHSVPANTWSVTVDSCTDWTVRRYFAAVIG